MPNNTVGTLSSSGWATDIKTKADKLLTYFLVSKYSQTNEYYGFITSFPYLLRRFGNDRTDLSIETQTALNLLFQRHYDDAQSSVIVKDSDTTPGKLSISITVTVTHEGENFVVGKLLNDVDSSLSNIIQYLNQ